MEQGPDDDALHRLASLTDRQREVLRLVSRDMNSKEIGRSLGVSDETVKNHIKAAVRRLGTTSRFDAARLLRRFERDDPRVVDDPTRVIHFPTSMGKVADDGVGRTGIDLRERRARFDADGPADRSSPSSTSHRSRSGGRTPPSGLQWVCRVALLTAAVAVAGVAAAPLARSVQELTNMVQAPSGRR